jgi:hypothetical protein
MVTTWCIDVCIHCTMVKSNSLTYTLCHTLFVASFINFQIFNKFIVKSLDQYIQCVIYKEHNSAILIMQFCKFEKHYIKYFYHGKMQNVPSCPFRLTTLIKPDNHCCVFDTILTLFLQWHINEIMDFVVWCLAVFY